MEVELLEDMASARGDPADLVAQEAFGEFYRRHAAWLYQRLCRIHAFRLLDSRDAMQDVVQETFYRVYKGAHTFDPNLVTDRRRIEALVRGWLGGIANRVIADTLRRCDPDAMESMRLERRQAAWGNATDSPALELPIVRALQEELQKLSPLQQDILAAAELYYQPDTNYQRLPNGVTKQLAEKHSTTSDNIRQVRRRTMAVLRAKLLPLFERTNRCY